jgi:hypothetical protein
LTVFDSKTKCEQKKTAQKKPGRHKKTKKRRITSALCQIILIFALEMKEAWHDEQRTEWQADKTKNYKS